MAVTLKDIALATNLSTTTVSLVLNNKKCRVAESTKELVRETAKKMNYHPNQLAIGLVNRQTNTIGLMIPDITNHFYSNLALGIDNVMHEHKKNILLFNTEYDVDRIKEGICTLQSKGVDAIILTATSVLPKYVSFFADLIKDSGIPIITVDHYFPELKCSTVQLNNRKGAYIAVKHLVELGHTNIVCITGPEHSIVSRERLAGYRNAYSDYNLELPEKYTFCGDFLMDGGHKAALKILDETNATAIFAFNDVMALGAIQALKERSLQIPQDISIIGFDNIDFSDMVSVPLTTVNQPAYEIGQEAARQVLFELDNPGVEKKNISFEPHLIIRKSTTRNTKKER